MIFSGKKYDEIEKELAGQVETDETEKSIKENPQEGMFEGVEADEFDVKPDFKTEFDEIIELKSRKGIELKYSFNGEEIKEALKIFQRVTICKRNLIYTGILAVIFIMYVGGIAKSGDPLSMFLAILCIVVIGFIWYMPLTHIKKTAKAADTHELNFVMTVYDDCVKIGEEDSSFVLHFNKEITKMFETPTQFLICAGKERVFLLPKRFLEDGQTNQLKDIFSAAMKENYIKKM